MEGWGGSSVTKMLRIVLVFSVKACSAMDGSSSPRWKGLRRKRASVIGRVGQEMSLCCQSFTRREGCYKRYFNPAGEAGPQTDHPVIKTEKEGSPVRIEGARWEQARDCC